jgi:hypothetical protein
MNRLRRSIDAAIAGVLIRLLSARLAVLRSERDVRRAGSELTERAQGLVATTLLERPALAALVSHLPVATLSEATAAAERRRDFRQTIVRTVVLTVISILVSVAVTALIRRRRTARQALPAALSEAAVAVAPAKELVAIPIVAEEPAAEPAMAEAIAEITSGATGSPASADT